MSSAVDDAIERATLRYDHGLTSMDYADAFHDRVILADEVKRLREELSNCRKGITRWRSHDHD